MEWKPRTRTRTIGGLVALLVLAALTVLALWGIAPPSPRDASAPLTDFSAARAYAHVERIGAHTHVVGSEAATDVRGYITSTLKGYGLQVDEQDAIGAEDVFGGYTMARVRNVVALLPGQDATGAVIMMAHYDSVQVSYGANDDGAGVSTLLETARILAAGPKPRNDIVFLFTDGEEACLCGAEAFVSQHPYAADGAVVLNFESAGASGPVITFETSRGNADLIAVYGRAVPWPVATSFAVEVYRLLPNDTDFTPFREAGRFTGLNAAYIDGSAVYHAPEDKPSYMDTASLQHHGDNAVALARAFGGEDLVPLMRPAADDATYFPVLHYLVRYPGWLVWPVAGVALLGVIGLAVMARRRALVTWGRLAGGFGLALVPLVVAPVLAQLLWTLLVAIRPGYSEMLDPWQPGWFRAGVVALVAAVILAWYGLFRRVGAWALAIGALLWLAVLGLVLAAVTPGGSYLAALPALAGAIAGLVAVSAAGPVTRIAVFTLGAAVAVFILAPTVQLFLPALGLQTGGASAFFAAMLGLALLPLLEYLYPPAVSTVVTDPPVSTVSGADSSTLDPVTTEESSVEDGPAAPARHRRWTWLPAGLATVLAIACVGVGLGVDRFDEAHPVPTLLAYALDADTGQAKWVSKEASPGEWTSQYVTGRENLEQLFPVMLEERATGPAQAAALPPPQLTAVSDVTANGQRTVLLSLRPQRPVRLVVLQVQGETKVLEATVAGRAVPASVATAQPFSVQFHAPPPGGLTVRLVLNGSGPAKIRVIDGSDGLDALPGFKPRPLGVGVAGSHESELVLVAKTYTI